MKGVKRGNNIVYVIDASVYAPLIVTCGKDLIRAMREIEFILLDLTVYEACNAFWKEYKKLHKINEDEAIRACMISKALTQYSKLYRITDLDIEDVMRIAVENNITVYDSSYIALSRKLKASIATEDKDIITLAPKYNIKAIRLHELMNLMRMCQQYTTYPRPSQV